MKLHILYGLPGSGKSTWAKKREEEGWHCIYADKEFDTGQIARKVRRVNRKDNDHVVLDTLVLNTKRLKELVESLQAENPNVSIVVEFWKKDIPACLLNDSQRPSDRRGDATIRHLGAQFVKPSKKTLEKLNIEFNEHDVFANKQLLDWKKKYEECCSYRYPDNPRYLYSPSWITGGRCWSYTGDEWDADVEEQPKEFEALDQLLEKEYPQISMLTYKKIYRDAVDIERFTDRDYYHDLFLSCYKCDLIKLANILNDR